MLRLDALKAVHARLENAAVVTIMGAVAAELQSIGHRPNFFYLQHGMGLASSIGLGIALSRPELPVVVFDGDGSVLMNLGGLTTLARYRPPNLLHVIFDNESLLSVGGFPTATSTGTDLAAVAHASGVPRTTAVADLDAFVSAFEDGLAARELTTIVAKVEAVGPTRYVTDLGLLENRFAFARRLKQMQGEASALQTLVAELVAGTVKVVDLTQPLGPATPVIGLPDVFAASPGVSIEEIAKYDARGPAWYWNTIRMGEHTGTHFDAPVHWITGRQLPANTTDTIPPDRFVGPACVIDATAEAARDPDYLLTTSAIEAWEAEHGRIPAGAWVLLRTGWSRRTGDAFQNIGPDGPHSPGFDAAASRLLAHDRDVLGVGVETIGTDAGQAGRFDPPFPNHAIMHGAGKFGLASLCNLDQLPLTGAVLIAAPLKLVNGSGSPVRALALVPA